MMKGKFRKVIHGRTIRITFAILSRIGKAIHGRVKIISAWTTNRFRKELLGRSVVTVFGLLMIVLTLLITFFLISKGLHTFTEFKYPLLQFLTGTTWDPAISATDPRGQVGVLVFIVGSLSVSLLGIVIATPFAVASAIFMAEISPEFGKRFFQPAVEIFVGIPSVVYGWVGYQVLCPAIAKVFHLPFGGESLLAAGIVLSLMIFPTITTMSTDAIRALPEEHREASYALGSTRWQMILHARLPAAVSGIVSGIVLGMARAFGEALAVTMVIGMSRGFTGGLLGRTSTLTTIIATSMGTAADDTPWTASLWSMALLLFIISFALIVIVRIVSRKGANRR